MTSKVTKRPGSASGRASGTSASRVPGRRLGVAVALGLLLTLVAGFVVLRGLGGLDGKAAAFEHVHGIGVDPADGAVYAGTHLGLFRLSAKQPPVRVADRVQDFMGFTVVGPNRFLASGHPAQGSLEPTSLGLIESSDGGSTWASRSLVGEADFHALQARHGRVYGYNSLTGGFMVSVDLRSWETRATLPMADFAVSPADPDLIVATTEQGVVQSADGGRSFTPMAGPVLLLISWADDGALVGVTPQGAIQISTDDGASWQLRGSVDAAPEALEVTSANELYVADGGAIRVSRDGGRTFADLAGN